MNIDDFDRTINELEDKYFDSDYILKEGKVPILFTAPHTMEQIKDDGSIKFAESFTKAIALYLNKYADVSVLIKINDTGLDSNRFNNDDFKKELMSFVRNNDIKLVIDLHGAKEERDFDVEFGTMNNLSADYSTIKLLEDSFIKNNITNIVHNDPFKGGAITQSLYEIKGVDAIQLEINSKFRNESNIEKLKQVCDALEDFINTLYIYL